MNIYSIFAVTTIAFTSSCSNNTESLLIDGQSEISTTQTIEGQPNTIVAQFSGATFVSVITSSIGTTNASARTSPNTVITFDADTVTTTQSGVSTSGQYVYNDDDTLVAQLPEGDVIFRADGGDLIWDSLNFRRAASNQFDSQESLTTYLEDARYTSVEQLDVGETAQGELVLGNWYINNYGDELHHGVQDTVSIANYAYLDGSSFTLNYYQNDQIAVVLDNGNLVVSSVTYERQLTDQFDSQESLIGFLDGKTYKSAALKPVGSTSDGITSLGYWFIDFIDDTYSQTLEDGVEAGTLLYTNINEFTATSDNQSYDVVVENDELVWNGTRYKQTVGE